jgi:type I restriction enzyme M protein
MARDKSGKQAGAAKSAKNGNGANLGFEAQLFLAADKLRGNLDELKDLRFDYILANPPFNVSDWGGERLREDARWKYGAPPVANANYAWLQHIIWHLSPNGTAGVVLANGSMSSGQSGEDVMRHAMVEADVVDCMISLPGQLFYSTPIPACLWFLARNKNPGGQWRDRRGEVLFIDARKLGSLVDRTRREFSNNDIEKIARTYHAWRGEPEAGKYVGTPGFSRAAMIEEIKGHNYVLTPGRYVGAADAEEDDVPFVERFAALKANLDGEFLEGDKIRERISVALAKLVI